VFGYRIALSTMVPARDALFPLALSFNSFQCGKQLNDIILFRFCKEFRPCAFVKVYPECFVIFQRYNKTDFLDFFFCHYRL